jgi:hypothetical protein
MSNAGILSSTGGGGGGGGVNTIFGDTGSATGSNLTLTGGTTGLTVAGSGSVLTLGGTLGVPDGGTGAATLTGILLGNGTSPITAIAGANNAVLATSATGVPSMVPSNTVGSWVFLSSQTASSSATISFTSVITSKYSTYVLVYSNVVPQTTGLLAMQVSINNGVSYLSSGYVSGIITSAYNSTTLGNQTSATNMILSGTLYNAGGGICGEAWLFNFQNGGTAYLRGDFVFTNSTPTTVLGYAGASSTATSVNAIQISMATGNITKGTFSLYGISE